MRKQRKRWASDGRECVGLRGKIEALMHLAGHDDSRRLSCANSMRRAICLNRLERDEAKASPSFALTELYAGVTQPDATSSDSSLSSDWCDLLPVDRRHRRARRRVCPPLSAQVTASTIP